MSDNVLQTLQKLVQDVIAPDVRELKVRLEGLSHEMNGRFDGIGFRFESMQKQADSRFEGMQKQVDSRFEGLQKQLESLSKENEAQYKSILAAIAESRAHSELAGLSAIAALRERIAVLEARAA